ARPCRGRLFGARGRSGRLPTFRPLRSRSEGKKRRFHGRSSDLIDLPTFYGVFYRGKFKFDSTPPLLISLLKLLEGRKGREGRKRPRFTDTLFFRPSSKVGRGRKNDRLPYILSFSQTAFGASHSIGWWVSSAKRARQTLSGGNR